MVRLTLVLPSVVDCSLAVTVTNNRWCAHYDCDALWIQNFQDGGEGREIAQVICFIFQ